MLSFALTRRLRSLRRLVWPAVLVTALAVLTSGGGGASATSHPDAPTSAMWYIDDARQTTARLSDSNNQRVNIIEVRYLPPQEGDDTTNLDEVNARNGYDQNQIRYRVVVSTNPPAFGAWREGGRRANQTLSPSNTYVLIDCNDQTVTDTRPDAFRCTRINNSTTWQAQLRIIANATSSPDISDSAGGTIGEWSSTKTFTTPNTTIWNQEYEESSTTPDLYILQ